jgi:hypothetical protein
MPFKCGEPSGQWSERAPGGCGGGIPDPCSGGRQPEVRPADGCGKKHRRPDNNCELGVGVLIGLGLCFFCGRGFYPRRGC